MTTFWYYSPFAVFGLALFFFVFPCKCKCFRSSNAKINSKEDDYDEMVLNFTGDYQRCNPVTSKQGWKDWLMVIEGKS